MNPGGFRNFLEGYVKGEDIAGLWMEPGMNQKAVATIKRVAPKVMADIAKWNWEMACQDTAYHWQEVLEKEGIASRFVDGRFVAVPSLYDNGDGDFEEDLIDDLATIHAWLEIGGKIFDPTAGQFSYQSRIWPVALKSIRRDMYVEE